MRRLITLACSTTLLAVWWVSLPAANAAFPGDNGAIVSNRFTEGQGDLWAFDPETSTLTRLTDTPRKNESLPDWNADGTRLAFTVCRGEFENCDIWAVDADGSNRTRLTFTPTFQETWPAWSPDGSKIAYTTNESDELQDVWVMDSDGSNPTQLTFTNGIFDAFPEWSPDGSKIAFTSDREAIDDIWVMDADGSDPARLTTGVNTIDERPDWSPDGTTITFSRNGKNIWSMDADGTDQTELLGTRRLEFASAYSPDGSMIVLNREAANGRIGVWIMSADGSGLTKLGARGLGFFPDWQPT